MLLGRTHERLAIDRLLAEARDGRSGVLALVGEPGIGKTALLQYVAEQAADMRVLRARGIESEAEIPFAGLSELLRPALSELDRIPAPQAQALAGALALGPARAGDRFAIGAATLSLLSAAAERQPLALLVDDAQWLDRSSAEALLFAARRLVADPIALLIAAREGEPSLLDGADLRVMRVAGLDRADAAALLDGVPADVVAHLFRATGGNPLALLQLASDTAASTVAAGAGPVPISASIGSAFLHRFGRLPEPTRRVLVLAATSDAGDLAVLTRAAAVAGLDVGALAAAEDAGLVTLDDGVVAFSHPLARAAMFAEASASERREAHAALAATLPDHEIDRRAWHLAAASLGPTEEASDALRQAGERARTRSAYAVSAAAFERGAALATTAAARGRLLVAAAEAAWLGGDGPAALRLLDDAGVAAGLDGDDLAATRSPDAATTAAALDRDAAARRELAARIEHLRGAVAVRHGPIADGYRLIVSAAERIADDDGDRAVAMLAEAVLACFAAGDTPAMIAAARRAARLADGSGSRRVRFFATIADGVTFVADGSGAAGAAAMHEATAILEDSDELADDPVMLEWSVIGPLWLREADAGRGLVERTIEGARAQAAVGVMPRLLHLLARDHATTERWSEATAAYDEAIRLARETGQRVELCAALAGLAWLEARQGREAACRAHAAEATALSDELGVGLYRVWAIQALGDVELALGRPEAAVARYQEQVEALRERGIADVDLSPAPELVEAYVRLGEPERAEPIAAAFASEARAKGQPWAHARAERTCGLLADGDEAAVRFDAALALHERTPDRFEAARTQLAYGARLRRARRRAQARPPLREAMAAFERLGAPTWAAQARAELAATGETARRRDASTLDDLTPQEAQIARLLAAGQTTREAAAALFVSPKTIEYHLRHVYDKLGVRSRAELAEALAGG